MNHNKRTNNEYISSDLFNRNNAEHSFDFGYLVKSSMELSTVQPSVIKQMM